MKIIEPSVELINAPSYETLLSTIETAGRVCYKSEDKIQEGSAEKFIAGIIKRGHEAVIEHGVITVKFICDRGVTHEIVRHRIASYCQESTRYCNYSQDKFGGEITVIRPCFLAKGTRGYEVWYRACDHAESAYFDMLVCGFKPQEARSVLPNSLKTEIVMTTNIREWRHFIKLRTTEGAHPQMRQVACMLANKLAEMYPIFFGDLVEVRW